MRERIRVVLRESRKWTYVRQEGSATGLRLILSKKGRLKTGMRILCQPVFRRPFCFLNFKHQSFNKAPASQILNATPTVTVMPKAATAGVPLRASRAKEMAVVAAASSIPPSRAGALCRAVRA